MANLRISTSEEKFTLETYLVDLAGSIYVLTGATNVYARNISQSPVVEETTTITDAANGIVQITFSSSFFQVGENKIIWRIDWSGTPAYSNTDYSIHGYAS